MDLFGPPNAAMSAIHHPSSIGMVVVVRRRRSTTANDLGRANYLTTTRLETSGNGFALSMPCAPKMKDARCPELAMLSGVSSSAAKSLMRKSTQLCVPPRSFCAHHRAGGRIPSHGEQWRQGPFNSTLHRKSVGTGPTHPPELVKGRRGVLRKEHAFLYSTRNFKPFLQYCAAGTFCVRGGWEPSLADLVLFSNGSPIRIRYTVPPRSR
jgi:hypothetical protein